MHEFMTKHPGEFLAYGLLIWFAFSNAVQALDPPDEKSSKTYRFIFKFLHGLAGNIRYALKRFGGTSNYIDDKGDGNQ